MSRMRTASALPLCVYLSLLGPSTSFAGQAGQSGQVPNSPGVTTPASMGDGKYTDAQLEQLLGPIALYPDSLLASVLTASMYGTEIAAASAFMTAHPQATQSQIDAQNWEQPVKTLCKTPAVLQNLAKYPDWTAALGAAYLAEPKEVMKVAQDLRQKAQLNGSLQSTPQQQVIVTPPTGTQTTSTIEIVPTNPQVIYVPTYTPAVVYAPYYDPVNPALTFGAGVFVGAAFTMGCFWASGWCGWHGYPYTPSWNNVHINNFNFNNTNIHNQWNNLKNDSRVGNFNNADGLRNDANRLGSDNRIGQEGNAYRANADKAALGAGAARMPNMDQMPRGGLGSLGDGFGRGLGGDGGFGGDRGLDGGRWSGDGFGGDRGLDSGRSWGGNDRSSGNDWGGFGGDRGSSFASQRGSGSLFGGRGGGSGGGFGGFHSGGGGGSFRGFGGRR